MNLLKRDGSASHKPATVAKGEYVAVGHSYNAEGEPAGVFTH